MASPTVQALRVIVPMKPLADAKSRLWAEVPTKRRESVILLMLDRVVRAAVEVLGPDACHVVGGDAQVRVVAEAAGAAWRKDPADGLNASLWSAMRSAYREGCTATMFLPGDLPLVTAADVRLLDRASEAHTRPAGVAAQRDGGTNALLLPAVAAFPPELGLDSFARHRAAAERIGTTLAQVEAPGLAFDLDTEADLTWALDHVDGFAANMEDWQQRLTGRSPA